MLKKIKKSLVIFSLICGTAGLAACVPDIAPPPQTSELPLTAPAPVSQRTHSSAPLYCKVGLGIALYGRNWDGFSETSFALYEDERVNIKIPRAHLAGTMTVQAFFDRSGQKMVFCPVVDAPPGQRIACASLYALDEDLHDGIKRTFDIPDAVRGGAITCAYEQKKLKKLVSYPSGGN